MNDSKEHILTVSLNLFIEKGFKEVTMQEIVQKTGLSKGAFYHYFNSKEQVFEEVINHFYTELITSDYSKFSQDSLHKFYEDLLNEKKARVSSSKIVNSNKEKVFTSHHYFLMFDAMKLLPNFKKLREDLQKKELDAWAKIIGVAKKSGEIKSPLSDKELAKLFIYTNKGAGLHCIMANNPEESRKEIKKIWDSLYNTITK